MKRGILIALILGCVFAAGSLSGAVKVKVRDIAYIDGLKENQVYGFGLVVGLQGSGDSKSVLTQSSLKNLLKNMGLQDDAINSRNSAAVLLTAKLPPYVRVGDKITVTVSSLGDAKSLEGGTLVQSPLRGADDRIYAVAQGPLSLDDSGKGRRAVKTVARIPDGGLIERDLEPEIVVENGISLVMNSWDFSEVNQILKAITGKYPQSGPTVTKGGKIKLALPENVNIAEFVSSILEIEVEPGEKARVVVNEKDGTIVMGGDVKISEAVVSKDGVTIKIEGRAEKGSVALIKETSTVKDLVDTLNFIGASTRDIISILKALKEAGALHADLIVR